MFEKEIKNINAVLGLKREVIGLRFLYSKKSYECLKLDEYKYKTSYCMMVRSAMDGNHFKANGDNVRCRCALEALGFAEEMPCVSSGERYYSINLYETRAIAKAVTKSITRIRQRIYGIEIGPLSMMSEADVVIMMTNPYQLMRVIEGYTYKFGTPTGFHMAGNQGVCSDISAAPFEENDLRISVLCAGTRKMARWDDDEMGVGMPIQLFTPVLEGIIKTLNYIEYEDRKKLIRERLESPNQLGIEIDDSLHYGKLGSEFCDPNKYREYLK